MGDGTFRIGIGVGGTFTEAVLIDNTTHGGDRRDRQEGAGTLAVFVTPRTLFHRLKGLDPVHTLVGRYRIVTWRLGPLWRTVGLSSLAEIAAGAF